MKKIFSAFLLMTMMVFSVGSFVSCSDLENELAQVEGTANDNAAAIESLNSELAALKTALSAAQADADAAMAAAKAAKEAGDAAKAEAEAAKAAAEQAKAEAIAAVMAEVEAIQTAIAQNVEAITNLSGSVNANAVEIEALQEEIKALQTAAAEHVYAITNLNGSIENHEMAIEDLKAELSLLEKTVANYEDNLKELNLFHEQYKTDIQGINYAITNLTTAVETNSADIQGLIEQFEEVVASVKAVNENLVAVYGALSALANQIQSIVYVPENLAGTAVAKGYTYGSDDDAETTDVLVKMTYEVSPKELATAITAENAVFSTVPVTKAAAAEHFKVQIVSAEASTGRVVAYAHIPVNSKSPAYKALTDNNAETNVALALNVADPKMISLLLGDEPEILDAGSYVQSSYVGVTPATKLWDDVYGLVGIYSAEDEEFITSANLDDIKVAYNTAPAVKSLFSGLEVRVNLEGQYMTLAQASEFLGETVAVTYALDYATYSELACTTKVTDTKKLPFTVTGTDLAATAQFTETESLKGAALLNYTLKVGLKNFKVNGEVYTPVTPVVKYTIAERQNGVTFSTVNKAWKYTEGDDAAVPSQELEVTLPGDELTDVSALFGGVGSASDATKDKKFTATWTDGTYNYTAEAMVYAVSKKAVVLRSVGSESRVVKAGANVQNPVTYTGKALQYPQGTSATRTFKANLTVDNTAAGGNKTTYGVSFDVVLGAMPTDEEAKIALGTFNINGSVKKDMTIENGKDGFVVNPVAKAIEVIANYDANVKNAVSATAPNPFTTTNLVGTTKVKIGNKDAVDYTANTSGHAKLTIAPKHKDNDASKKIEGEASKIVVEALEELSYVNTIVLTQKHTFCGVDFTYSATINTVKPELSFAPSTAYVTADKKVELDGTVKLPINKGVTGTSTPYTLNAIDLRNYVNVTIPENLANDYVIRYTLKTDLYDEEEEEYLVNYVDADGNDVLYTNYDRPAFADVDGYPVWSSSSEYATSVKLDPTSKCPVLWNTDLTEAVYEIALVSKTPIDANGDDRAEEDDVFASFEVTLVIPELLTFTADEVVKVKIENGVATKGNIVGALSIVDKFGNKVYNEFVTDDLNKIWKGYKGTLNSKNEVINPELTDVDFFNVYGGQYGSEMFFTVDEANIKAYIGSADVTSQINFDFVNSDEQGAFGTIILTEESATIQGDVEFHVPVVLNYIYDNFGKNAKSVVAKVLFTVNDVEDNSGANYPTPAGKQWQWTEWDGWSQMMADVPGIIDFNVTDINPVINQYGMSINSSLVFAEYYAPQSPDETGVYMMNHAFIYEVVDVIPNSTSEGVIQVQQVGGFVDHVVEIPYRSYNGTSCTFDFSLFSLGEVTCTAATTTINLEFGI